MKVSPKARKAALISVGIVVAIFITTEYLYYFPLTPLSLDLRGETGLPGGAGEGRLLFVGDMLLADAARGTIASEGHDHIFGATRSLIRAADLAVGNLEGPIATGGEKQRKRWSYRMSREAAPALARAGFDLVDLANNHIKDCGDRGVTETLEHLRRAGVTPFGAGATRGEAHRAVVRRVRGVSVAFLGYMPREVMLQGRRHSWRSLAAGPARPGTAHGSPGAVAEDIKKARRVARVVIVSFHLGDRYQADPTAFERRLCRHAVDAGADAVIGHGTHVMGPIEVYRGKPIFYSLGNFAFGSGNVMARFSLVAVLQLDPRRQRLSGFFAMPVYTVNRNPWVRFQTKLLVGAQARRVLGSLVERSGRYQTALSLVPDPWRVTARLAPADDPDRRPGR